MPIIDLNLSDVELIDSKIERLVDDISSNAGKNYITSSKIKKLIEEEDGRIVSHWIVNTRLLQALIKICPHILTFESELTNKANTKRIGDACNLMTPNGIVGILPRYTVASIRGFSLYFSDVSDIVMFKLILSPGNCQ